MAKGTAARNDRRPRVSNDTHDVDAARRGLLEQHERLRVLLRALDAKAVAVIRTPSGQGPDLRPALEDTAQILTDHMRGEERALTELLPKTRAPANALGSLREDHARQTEELDRMRRCAASWDDAISLALAVRAFVADVLLDMKEEDRRYLSSTSRAEACGGA